MDDTTSFRINSPQVVHETIDNETILLNLENGSYYSLDEHGAFVWTFIENGFSLQEMIHGLAGHYPGQEPEIVASITSLLIQMTDQGLLVPLKNSKRPEEDSNSKFQALLERAPASFRKPVLNIYTDMKDLLLLDPIHDVDATGWPSAASD